MIGKSIEHDHIYIKLPDLIHYNFGLCIFLHNKSVEKIKLFKSLCHYAFMNHNLDWFMQGGSLPTEDEWCYFEFWGGYYQQDLILDIALKISESMNLPCEIEN